MANRWLIAGASLAILASAACAPKRVAAPPPAPPARQNIFALLPEREGAVAGIVVRNQAGSQDLTKPYQAVRVERSDVAPGAPYPLDEAAVRRLFGAALDALPAPEALFVLHFDEGRDALNTESLAQVPAILAEIRARHSTAITVTGHTDNVDTPAVNYRLGLRRAQTVAAILQNDGVNSSDIFISSHGSADLLVKTLPNTPEVLNRRVEVIVR